MDTNDKLLAEISELLIRTMDHSITGQEFDHLQSLLKTNPTAREYYFDLISTFSGVEEIQSYFGDTEGDMTQLMKALSNEEKTSPKIDLPEPAREPVVIQQVDRSNIKLFNFDRRRLYHLVAYVAAILVVIVTLQLIPVRRDYEVATLMDSLNVEWGQVTFVPEQGGRLSTGRDTYQIESGFAELQYDSGVNVLIEGPAEFSVLNDDQIKLSYGQLYASVPQEAIGFSVVTFNSKVIDLGTEFGVSAQSGSNSQLYVMEGKVNLVAGSKNQRFTSLVHQGQARRISGAQSQVADISYDNERFVRKISSQAKSVWRGQTSIDLADIASGGNGFGTALPQMGIDVRTGQFVEGNAECRGGVVKGYIPVPGSQFVDGVFIPDGDEGAVQITSDGHTYDGFESTNGFFYMAIGAFQTVDRYYQRTQNWDYDVPLGLEGLNGQVTNLCMHASSGITFDLQAIRQTVPFLNIERFESFCGIGSLAGKTAMVNFYVFVDGKPVAIKKDVSGDDDPIQFAVDLNDDNRFLTLICTEGASNYKDWSLFVNPRLEVELKN